jgi:hypothetical protein
LAERGRQEVEQSLISGAADVAVGVGETSPQRVYGVPRARPAGAQRGSGRLTDAGSRVRDGLHEERHHRAEVFGTQAFQGTQGAHTRRHVSALKGPDK